MDIKRLASLPTPPRTTRKRKRGGERARSPSSDEDNADFKAKRDADADSEAAFWLSNQRTSSTSTSPPLLYRRLAEQQANSSLLSPPPSHRKPTATQLGIIFPSRPPTESPHTPTPDSPSPSTPPATPPPFKRPKLDISPRRDSPENPFLAAPIASNKDDIVVTSEPVVREEKPTVAFVFRGVRRTFPNPYFGAAPNPNSQLPPEHPDYEPDERAVSKLVFGVKKTDAGGIDASTCHAAESARQQPE
uniref:Uncharacterized protein n=1 Tax=Mycena chlorophos TaxID=658473 RepID=A0ABQ0M600_MYCCL|nr:predicted protein [Mycena chlorophos]